jgi:hypothetical protein
MRSHKGHYCYVPLESWHSSSWRRDDGHGEYHQLPNLHTYAIARSSNADLPTFVSMDEIDASTRILLGAGANVVVGVTIGKLHVAQGMQHEHLSLCKQSTSMCKVQMLHSSSGKVPWRELPFKSKRVNAVKEPRSDGTVPVNALFGRYN